MWSLVASRKYSPLTLQAAEGPASGARQKWFRVKRTDGDLFFIVTNFCVTFFFVPGFTACTLPSSLHGSI